MLLKVGAFMMVFALAFAGVVTVITLLDEPTPARQLASAAKPAPEPSLKPLVREYLPPKQEVKNAEVQPEPQKAQAKPKTETAPAPAPAAHDPEPQRNVEPVAEGRWSMPTQAEVSAASGVRRYQLPRGAVMGLTIKAIGLHNVPVFDSGGQWALDNGVAHIPGTSLPWSGAPQRNVYLAGHRLGWRGTDSYLVFYDLDELSRGNKILLRDREGKKYFYRVTEAFVADPGDSWVMGQVRGRDMLTLQTCTPIPRFDKRLIIRADRI